MKNIIFLVISFLFLTSCDKNEDPIQQDLTLVGSYSIAVPEPSDLVIDATSSYLYTVSDNTNRIYKMTTSGTIVQTFPFVGNDLEGVCFFEDKILVTEERTKKVIEYDATINTYLTHPLNYENQSPNEGLEGITYNPNTNTIYVINEKNPGILLLLNEEFEIVNTLSLNFADDYSGICYDAHTNSLWIVSDESRTINKCNLVGELIKSYPINVTKAEGIAVTNNNIFIVSDSTAEVYIYNKPSE